MSKKSRRLDTFPNVWVPSKPFNDLPRLPPSADLETKPVLKLCIEARAALAELKRAAELIPNQGMLVNTLPVLEARASSEIENIVTTADEMFRSLPDSPTTDPAAKEALRYREALLEGYRLLAKRPLGTVMAEEIVSRIKGVRLTVRKSAGTVLRNDATGEVVYTPPQGEQLLRELLANWEKFLHDDVQIDPLVRLAAAHYQLEAIHPFSDGNGRTGRILNSLFLIEAGLLSLPILYLSRYFIANKASYYQGLFRVTADSDWSSWIEYVVQGVQETAEWTLAKIDAIRRLQQNTVEYLQTKTPKIYSRELVDLIFEQPYSRIANVVERGIAKRQTASKYLYELVDAHVLEARESGRQVLFVHTRLLGLLTQEENDFDPYAH
jgi:Fic family protein